MAKTLSKFIKPDAMIILDHLSAQYLLYLILGGMLSVEVLVICRLDRKTHRYRQQWPQDTERRPAKH
jgi:hypothetical protein